MTEMRNLYYVSVGKPKIEDHSENWKIILKWVLEKQCGEVVDWIPLAQDRDQWLAVVKTVMNIRVP
jgi:hypothetical protein